MNEETIRRVFVEACNSIVKEAVKEEINKRLPPGMMYIKVKRDGDIIGFYPYVDSLEEKIDR
jgi:hypothetical protein